MQRLLEDSIGGLFERTSYSQRDKRRREVK